MIPNQINLWICKSAEPQLEQEAARLAELRAAGPAVLAAEDERVAGQEEAAARTAGVAGKEVNFVGVMMEDCQ